MKLISIITVIALVYLPFIQTAHAEPLNSTISFSSCAAGAFISSYISKGLKALEKTVTDSIKNWLIRQGIMRIPSKDIRGFPIPGLSESVPVSDGGTQKRVENFEGSYVAKEHVEDIITRCAAREILTAMGKNITNVARTSGRDGGPAWIRNWRNFQLDSQYRGEGIFKGILNSTKLCNYFEADLKKQFDANKNVNLSQIKTRADAFDSFQVRGGCTMPNNFSYNNYKRDFSGNGGWEAWSRLLEPQNNYYGSFLMSLDEANKQRAIEESSALNEALAGSGFLGTRGKNANDSCAVKSPFNDGGRCLVYKDVLTPGGVLGGAVVSGIEAELQWVATTDEVSELIATAINILVNRLWNLDDPNEGDYIVPGDLEIDPVPATIPPGGTPLPGSGKFTWNWIDQGGLPYESSKCPDTDPQAYFMSLVGDKDPQNWEQVLNDVEPSLWACGIGQQRDTAGGVRGRLYLPTAECNDASPADDQDKPFGVKQDPICWNHAVTVVEEIPVEIPEEPTPGPLP